MSHVQTVTLRAVVMCSETSSFVKVQFGTMFCVMMQDGVLSENKVTLLVSPSPVLVCLFV